MDRQLGTANTENSETQTSTKKKATSLRAPAVGAAAAAIFGGVELVESAIIPIAAQTLGAFTTNLDGGGVDLAMTNFGSSHYFIANGFFVPITSYLGPMTLTGQVAASLVTAVRGTAGTISNWPNPSTTFLFNGDNGGVGWIRVSSSFSPSEFKILAGEFQATPGPTSPLHVGGTATVPEPSSFAFLGMLAAGAGGVAAYKKRRKKSSNSEADDT